MSPPGLSDTLTTPGAAPAALVEPRHEQRVHERERVDSLDLLRGCMALMVAIYHFNTWTHVLTKGTRLSSTLIALGLYSVQGFFIVSGFCFFHLYRHTRFTGRELARFHTKRFFRIAPLYYAAVLLSMACAQPSAAGFTWARLVENLTLTFGLVHPNHSFVLGGWSIGLEYVFYLAFPFVVWLTRRPGALYLLLGLLAALAVPMTFEAVPAAPIERKFHAYVQLPNHAFLFVLGGAIADLRARVRFRLGTHRLALSLFALFALAVVRQRVVWDHFDVVIGAARVEHLVYITLAALLVALHDPADAAHLRPFRWFGDLSYSLYLLHPFAYLLVANVLLPEAPAPLHFALGLPLGLALSALSYRYLEKPLIRVGKRLAS